jgi:TPR repeat protein
MPKTALRGLALLLVLATHTATALAARESRVALVIGNSAYQNTATLTNPRNDALDVAVVFKQLGFKVIEGLDLDKAGMDRKIRDFAEALTSAEVAAFFYAGHGMQVGGQNYLVPIDAKAASGSALDFEMVRLDLVQRTMEREAKTNLVFLDACRDNPLSRNLSRSMGTRSADVGHGLAVVESGVGTLISFSTQPGNVALDGQGRNSPFAEALVKHMSASSDDLSSILIAVRNDVMSATANKQVPWEHSALRARFYFRAPAAAEPAAVAPPPVLPGDTQLELAFWNTVKDSGDAAALQAYIDRYPKGTFSGLAAVMIERLKREKTASAQPVAPRPAPIAPGPAAAGRNVALQIKLLQRPGDNAATRAWMGVQISTLEPEWAKGFGLDGRRGAWVTSVTAGGPAEAAKLLPGDVILKFDGRDVASSPALSRMIGETPPDKVLGLDVWRVGQGALDLGRTLRTRADAGDIGAMASLGHAYSMGVFGPKDEAEAARWRRKAADGGNASAMRGLAAMYETGRGLTKDEQEAARWYRKSADAGDPTAMGTLGIAYEMGRGVGKDDAEAVRWYRKGAEAGDPAAMANVGRMYAFGKSVAKDEAEAVRWYRKGADAGNTGAMANLAGMLSTGRGVTKDDAEAARWYRRAAELGHPYAMTNVGVMYQGGRGVAKDDAEAARWYRRGADAGDAAGMTNLGAMYEHGRGVTKDEAEAARWYRKAAEANQLQAMNNLGVLLRDGRGVTKDEAEAVRWYRKAADAGLAIAMANLGFMYETGRGLAKDDAEALKWYRKGAEANSPAAMLNLAIMHQAGRGTAKDENEAFRWHRKAAEAGHPSAMRNLSTHYAWGRGVARDPATASQWMLKALQAGDQFAYKQLETNSGAWDNDFRRELQRRLKEAGVYDGTADGNFGPATKQALEKLKQRPK